MKYTQEEIGTFGRGHMTPVMLNILLTMMVGKNGLWEKVSLRKKKGNSNFPDSHTINIQCVPSKLPYREKTLGKGQTQSVSE